VGTPARGSGDLLAGVSVAVLDGSTAALAAGWWLAELGADVSTAWSGLRRSGADPLTRFLSHRMREASPTSCRYGVTGAGGDAAASHAVEPGGTVLRITGPESTVDGRGWADVVSWARSGLGHLTRAGHPSDLSQLPRIPRDEQASILAGTATALGVCALEISARRGRPLPRLVEVDRQEVLAALPQQPIAAAQIGGGEVSTGRRFPGGVHQAADGLVFVQPFEPVQWARLLTRVGGAPSGLSDPPTFEELSAQRDRIDAALADWVADQPVAAVVSSLQDDHVPAAPVSEPDAVLRSEPFTARGFVGDEGPTVPWIRTLPAAAGPEPDGAGRARRLRPSTSLPLDGLRVLDLTWAWAGPFATTMLADLGAEVVNIEWWPRPSNLRPQPPTVQEGSPNAGGWWSSNQRGKLSVGVNLKAPTGVEIVRELAAVSDVVVENFSPGVVDRLGVGFDDLVRVNRQLVYVSMSAFGATGPCAHWVGYGTQILTASGMARATHPDDGEVALMGIPYPDPVSGLAGALAAAAAVGRGAAHLDLSELEATCPPIFGSLLHAPSAAGSRRAVVLAAADGRAVVVSAADDHAALEDLARTRTGCEVVEHVRDLGGDGVVVATPAEVLADRRLRSRGFWRRDEAGLLAAHEVEVAGPIVTFDGERPQWWRGAPDLFQDTGDVLRQILGYSRERIEQLVAEGAIGASERASTDAP
jgi:crotonobetainyl-CoA:carnitine CoA-transferase CaiB-like acyl-CoA transferase